MFFFSANVRIFDDLSCRRAYGNIFDPNTEICAGDYNQQADTMVRKNIQQNQYLFFLILERRFRWSFTYSSIRWSLGCSWYNIIWFSNST